MSSFSIEEEKDPVTGKTTWYVCKDGSRICGPFLYLNEADDSLAQEERQQRLRSPKV